MTEKEIIKLNLSKALKNSGIPPKEIAQLTGISYNLIKSYIDKKSLPTVKNFVIIVIALKLDANDIFDVDNQKIKK